MVNRYLLSCEVFLHFDKNTFYIWNEENSIRIKYQLKISYEPYIQKIDDKFNVIAVLIESREQGQELLIFKFNKYLKNMKLLQKCPTSSRVYDIKITDLNCILLINLTRLYVYNYQTRKLVKKITLIEPYYDQQVIKRYFSDLSEDFFVSSKMQTHLNEKNQYVNIVQRPYEQQVRIFSVNPYNQEDNFIGIFLIKSNFFGVIEKNIFITNQLKDNTIIIYRYDSKQRDLLILYRVPIFFMNTLKLIPKSKLLLNITIGQKQVCVDYFKIKFQTQPKRGKENHNNLDEESEDTIIDQEGQVYLHLLKIERKENPNLSENFSDLSIISQKKKYMIGLIQLINSKFVFSKLFDFEFIFRNNLAKNILTNSDDTNQLVFRQIHTNY